MSFRIRKAHGRPPISRGRAASRRGNRERARRHRKRYVPPTERQDKPEEPIKLEQDPPGPERSQARLGRHPIPQALRRGIRAQAAGRCEGCGRPLEATKRAMGKERAEYHDTISLAVYDGYPCWRCHRPCRVVRVPEGGMWLDESDLGRMVGSLFPAYYEDYSKTAGGRYWANHCPTCGAILGDWFIMEWLASEGSSEGSSEERAPVEVIELPYYHVEGEDREWVEEWIVSWGHVHHKDGNPGNNAAENLQLLCVRCHGKAHGVRSQPTS